METKVAIHLKEYPCMYQPFSNSVSINYTHQSFVGSTFYIRLAFYIHTSNNFKYYYLRLFS